MKLIIFITLILVLSSASLGLEFFSTASVETYRTDLNTTMISPSIFFQLGRFEGYGFWDRYLNDEGFYHGEFMLAYTPFRAKYINRFSIIAESRWDKYAKDENSVGIRIKLW